MSQLDTFIAECDRYLDTCKGDPLSLTNRVYNAYAREIEVGCAYGAFDLDRPDIQMVRDWLAAYREKREHELAVARAHAGHVSVSNSASASASAQATLSSTMAQVWSLPGDVMTDDQRHELEALLKGLDEAEGESKLKKAGRAVCDWLFDNAVKAVPTVMPYVAQAVQSGLGL